jgi:hypothetical protein
MGRIKISHLVSHETNMRALSACVIKFSAALPTGGGHDAELHFPKSEVKMTMLSERILPWEANPEKATMILDIWTQDYFMAGTLS